MQINRYFCGVKIRNRKVYCLFVLVSIGICDMHYIFIWRSHVLAHPLIYTFVFSKWASQHGSINLFEPTHITVTSETRCQYAISQTSVISHSNLALSVNLLGICLLLQPKSPTSKLKIANYLPGPFFLCCFQPTALILIF